MCVWARDTVIHELCCCLSCPVFMLSFFFFRSLIHYFTSHCWHAPRGFLSLRLFCRFLFLSAIFYFCFRFNFVFASVSRLWSARRCFNADCILYAVSGLHLVRGLLIGLVRCVVLFNQESIAWRAVRSGDGGAGVAWSDWIDDCMTQSDPM